MPTPCSCGESLRHRLDPGDVAELVTGRPHPAPPQEPCGTVFATRDGCASPPDASPTAPDTSADFGGTLVPEALIAALDELDAAPVQGDGRPRVPGELERLLRDLRRPPVASSPTCRRLREHAGGARVLLKREDLNHTGSHKINNVLGQALLTQRMGKTRVIAETGAGQHGVATATAAALLGLECAVYMGEVDTERQALNVARMRMLGAEVVPVTTAAPPSRTPSTRPCATG